MASEHMRQYEKQWEILMDWIEEQQALTTQFHGYIMDPRDLDVEGCFV